MARQSGVGPLLPRLLAARWGKARGVSWLGVLCCLTSASIMGLAWTVAAALARSSCRPRACAGPELVLARRGPCPLCFLPAACPALLALLLCPWPPAPAP
jgi:drug/metabolite transporter (DMT)-like permease